MPAKEPKRDFKVGDKVRVNLHHAKIEDAVVRAVIHDDDGIKLQVDVVGLDLTALIDTRQVVERGCSGATSLCSPKVTIELICPLIAGRGRPLEDRLSSRVICGGPPVRLRCSGTTSELPASNDVPRLER